MAPRQPSVYVCKLRISRDRSETCPRASSCRYLLKSHKVVSQEGGGQPGSAFEVSRRHHAQEYSSKEILSK